MNLIGLEIRKFGVGLKNQNAMEFEILFPYERAYEGRTECRTVEHMGPDRASYLQKKRNQTLIVLSHHYYLAPKQHDCLPLLKAPSPHNSLIFSQNNQPLLVIIYCPFRHPTY